MLTNEITIFRPNSRKREATISSPIAARVTSALEERLGATVANKARKQLSIMKKEGIEFLQFRHEDRKVRLRVDEA